MLGHLTLTIRCKVYIHVARAIAISPPRSAVSVYPDRSHAPHPFRIHAPLQLRIHTLSSTSTSIILACPYCTCTTLTVSCGSPLMYLSLSLWCFKYHHLSLVLKKLSSDISARTSSRYRTRPNYDNVLRTVSVAPNRLALVPPRTLSSLSHLRLPLGSTSLTRT